MFAVVNLLFRSSSGTSHSGGQTVGSKDSETEPFYSIFPVENEELVYGTWEEKVILDDQVCYCSYQNVACGCLMQQKAQKLNNCH